MKQICFTRSKGFFFIAITCLGIGLIVATALYFFRHQQVDAEADVLYNRFGLQSCSGISLLPSYATSTPRATILDRAGVVLAISQMRALLYAKTADIPAPMLAAQQISKILGTDKRRLDALFSSGSNICIIKEGLSCQLAKKIAELNIPGIGIYYYFVRNYPYGDIVQDVVGDIGPSGQGISGIEYFYNNRLSSVSGSHDSFSLSLDMDLQAKAGSLLKWQIGRLRADRGSLIFMDVKTGAILAMVGCRRVGRSYEFTDSYLKAWLHPVVIFPCLNFLSTAGQKNFAKDNAGQNISCNCNVKRYKKAWFDTFNGQIAYWGPASSNLFGFDDENCGHFIGLLSALGFGQDTGIDLPGESQGFLAPVSAQTGMTLYFCRNIMASPLQIVTAFSAILNGGRECVPHLKLDNKPEVHTRVVFRKEEVNHLVSMLSEGHGVSIASLYLTSPDSSFASSHSPAQVVALGFYPASHPRIVYMLALGGVTRDPRHIRGVLGRTWTIAEKATTLPVIGIHVEGKLSYNRGVKHGTDF